MAKEGAQTGQNVVNKPDTPYVGPIWTNQISRKLGVFGRKLGEATPHFVVISINIDQKIKKRICKSLFLFY